MVALREGVETRSSDGDLDVEVAVYDGSEIGQLQAGFNRMVAGLRERERIQDLFGRHVGEEVARAALEQEIELGGETREVAILFIDVVGSTELAAERPRRRSSSCSTSSSRSSSRSSHEHGGWVNKFEGDAALAVFGAPVPLDDAAAAALAAARELAERLRDEVELEAAIGVSAGEVVAGNIGEERRFEYTVIGDPVNEAARLTELAKERAGARCSPPGRSSTRRRGGEREHWRLDGKVTLRGRREETEARGRRQRAPLRSGARSGTCGSPSP